MGVRWLQKSERKKPKKRKQEGKDSNMLNKDVANGGHVCPRLESLLQLQEKVEVLLRGVHQRRKDGLHFVQADDGHLVAEGLVQRPDKDRGEDLEDLHVDKLGVDGLNHVKEPLPLVR